MVTDAEKYKEEDEKQKDRIAAKNSLESYSFNMKSTFEDEKLKDKISEEDKKTISDKYEEVINWLDANNLAEKDEFEYKQEELEEMFNRIIPKLDQAAGSTGGGMPPGDVPNFGEAGTGGSGGPTIEGVQTY